jgi:hypothetical protein
MIAKVLLRLVNGNSIPLRLKGDVIRGLHGHGKKKTYFGVQLERIIFRPVEEADLGLVLWIVHVSETKEYQKLLNYQIPKRLTFRCHYLRSIHRSQG